jgi:hypothetical protein
MRGRVRVFPKRIRGRVRGGCGCVAGQMRPAMYVCVSMYVCVWFWTPATPATHPRIVYIFSAGRRDPPATHPEPPRPTQRRRAAATHPRPTRDPPRAAATHPEEIATSGGPPRPNRDPLATHPQPTQSRRGTPRGNRKEQQILECVFL